jgi:hypothetical protein
VILHRTAWLLNTVTSLLAVWLHLIQLFSCNIPITWWLRIPRFIVFAAVGNCHQTRSSIT